MVAIPALPDLAQPFRFTLKQVVSGTMARKTTVWPAATARCSIRSPPVSFSRVRVSLTVMMASGTGPWRAAISRCCSVDFDGIKGE